MNYNIASSLRCSISLINSAFFLAGIVRGPVGVSGADAGQGGVPRTTLRPPRGGDYFARRGGPKVKFAMHISTHEVA